MRLAVAGVAIIHNVIFKPFSAQFCPSNSFEFNVSIYSYHGVGVYLTLQV